MSVPTSEYEVYAKEFGGSCSGSDQSRWPRIMVSKTEWKKRGWKLGFREEYFRIWLKCLNCGREWEVDVDARARRRALNRYNLGSY